MADTQQDSDQTGEGSAGAPALAKSPTLQRLLDRVAQGDLTDFTGAHVTATVPVPEDLVNAFAREMVLTEDGLVRTMNVWIKAENVVSVAVTVRKWGISKAFSFDLTVEKVIAFPESPKLKMWLPSSQALLGSITEVLAQVFEFLPPGVAVTGRLIELDLKTLLPDEKTRLMLRYISSGELTTEAGKLIFDCQLQVDG